MKNSKFHTLLREPLLHFLLIGAALFLVYNLLNEDLVENNRIVISEAEIDRLIAVWEKKRQRLPTQDELQGMIEQQVREEVMYREALAMGLDKNDSIVRRRLAQKVEFISADIAALAKPDEAELSDYLIANSKQFEQPARIDFVQVFINPDKHAENIQDYTKSLLNELAQSDLKRDFTTLGDSLMLEQQHQQVSEHDVTRLLGKDFASQLFILPVGSWQGPVVSGYGVHLVRVENKVAAQLPELEAIREKVQNEWFAKQRRIMDEAFYKGLRQRYEIVIEKPSEKDIIVSTEP